MPRGSKPGERRGGRQRGTPNKSTLMKHVAIKAAATDPNLSPLEFFLKFMRQQMRWSRKFGQRDKWSYCLMAGTLCPLDQERP